ncbi:Protein involved in sister chromatid separation and/or segregation [Phaffia rhodozyma]|uniref:Protein involved in sister chromatid separation and/or segregation n=1 Tax=Phaffia rhodozyma TaxID=264483 RepID=A0A0F7SP61_PHARH|nr:Protein involved in sister chromatid separation and/or segregation [Phaffia rhodozyma]
MSQPAAFTRLNQREADPNPSFGFITALPGKPQEEKALSIMKALAAQVKVICKTHGLKVYSFEEHPYNTVFAGRNWNAGEAIEIVLRRKNDEFFPSPWLISVVCHELAHIKHMNHGPGFQKFNEELKREVAIMQSKGNYGDGFWSSGARLKDSLADHENVLLGAGDFAENICGGAQRRQRPTSSRRRQRNNTLGLSKGQPSLHSGAQTAKKRKSGTRNVLAFREAADGNRVDGLKKPDPDRLPTTSDEESPHPSADESEDHDLFRSDPEEYELIPETDAEKRIAQQTSLLEEEEEEADDKHKKTSLLSEKKGKTKSNLKGASSWTIQNGFDAYLESIKIKSEPIDLSTDANEDFKPLEVAQTDPPARPRTDLARQTKDEPPVWACEASRIRTEPL